MQLFPILLVPLGQEGVVLGIHRPFIETCPFGQVVAGLVTHFPFTKTSPFLHSCKHLPFFCVWPLGHLQTPFIFLPPMHSLTHSSPFNLSPGLQMHLPFEITPFLHFFPESGLVEFFLGSG